MPAPNFSVTGPAAKTAIDQPEVSAKLGKGPVPTFGAGIIPPVLLFRVPPPLFLHLYLQLKISRMFRDRGS